MKNDLFYLYPFKIISNYSFTCWVAMRKDIQATVPKRELNLYRKHMLLLPSIHPTSALPTVPWGYLLGNLSSSLKQSYFSDIHRNLRFNANVSLNTGPQGLPYIPIQLWLILKMFRRNVGKKVVRYIHWSFRSEIFSPTEPEQESFSTQKLWKSVAEEIILKGR